MIKIDKINIDAFGKLNGLTFAPSSGINILCAPNEYGKSTVVAFIRFIFYGFVNTKVKDIAENDRKLYMPWDAQKAAGSIEITTDTGSYSIERTYTLPSKEAVRIIDIKTRAQVYNGLCPGEVFFGVNEEIFTKTSYISQLCSPINKDGTLAANVQNLVFTADEQTSVERALKRLNDAKNTLKNRLGKGAIPETQSELAAIEGSLAGSYERANEISVLTKKLAEISAGKAENELMLEKLCAERDNMMKYSAYLQLQHLQALRDAESEAKEQYMNTLSPFAENALPSSEVLSDIEEKEALINDLNIKRVNAEKALLKKRAETVSTAGTPVNADAIREELLDDIQTVTNNKTYALVGMILTFVMIAFSALIYSMEHSIYYSIAPSILAVAFLAFSIVSHSKVKNVLKMRNADSLTQLTALLDEKSAEPQREPNEAELAGLKAEISSVEASIDSSVRELKTMLGNTLAHYNSNESFSDSIKSLGTFLAAAERAKTIHETQRTTRIKAFESVDVHQLAATARGAAKPMREAEDIERELRFCESKRSGLEKQALEAEKQKSALEASSLPISQLLSKRDALQDMLIKLNGKYEALTIALNVLEESSTYMKSTVSPKIAMYASEYFKAATNGKYSSLLLDTNLLMEFTDNNTSRSSDYLSAGTKDLAYLCLRLALIKMLYNTNSVPVILDDAFGKLDNERLAGILATLATVKKDAQIFIFACTKREQATLKAMNIQYCELI